jgi:hypothetical protein
MKIPGRVDFTSEQIETLIERIEKKCLAEEDYSVLASLIRAIVWLNLSLQEKKISIERLRKIFGIKTESAKKLLKIAGETDEPETSSGDDSSSDETEEECQSDAKKKVKKVKVIAKVFIPLPFSQRLENDKSHFFLQEESTLKKTWTIS